MSESEIIKEIKAYKLGLCEVKNQTEAICIQAMHLDGYYLLEVTNQTEAICEAAINQDPNTLSCVDNQTQKLCKLAVQKEGTTLQFIKEQTPELCKLAVHQNIWAIEHINIFHKLPISYIEEIKDNIKKYYPEIKDMSPKEILKHFKKKKI